MNAGPTRILIVDDSALYRQSIDNVLREVDMATVVGKAKDGLDALNKIEQLDPDLLTLDVQMPDMDGISLLREIKRRGLRPKAIMVSSYTARGADVTTAALMEGAFDFILKPSSSDSQANRTQLFESLHEKISAFRLPPEGRSPSDAFPAGSRRSLAGANIASDDVVEAAPSPGLACEAVILGTSTGGPAALKAVCPKLPAELPVPVFVVQHMPPKYTHSLATRLNDICVLDVVEATDRTEVVAGKVLIAPGGQQMKLQRSGGSVIVRVNDDPPENGVRPSVDYFLRSAVEVLHGNALAVIMTGMGSDGLSGSAELKAAGGFVFAQSPDDCVVYGMPKAVVAGGLADRILPLGKIAPAVVRHVKRSRRIS